MNFRLALAVLLFPFSNLAQLGFEYDASVMVINGVDTLENPWAGGLNYPQFSDFDFDFDGDLDLFIFDRSKNNIRVYTQEGTTDKYYKFAYNSSAHFPDDIQYRCALVDYDNDGRKDLFTYSIGGLKVYRNVGDIVNGLQWELYQPVVNSLYPLGVSPLGVSSSDIPAIEDIDGDGDIDVLTFNMLGNRVEYHQNQSMDLYGIPDSLIFELKNECWGKFTEHDQNNSIVLNDPNAPCVGGNIPNPEGEGGQEAIAKMHIGSSLLAIDIDNSGVMDLLIGDASYSSFNLVTNGGTVVNTDSPMISVEYNFPSNSTPIKITLFPAAYFLDVDFDGIKDLIAAPNALNVSYNETSVKFYKNVGSNANPVFVHTSNNFLQSGMIEHGTGSIPLLFDVDEDGLEDLLVANYYRFKPVNDKECTIAYYKNVGTPTTPVYQFIDYNYLDLSSLSYGLKSVPTFGDIDDDGDEDLFLGIENGTIVYYENLSIGAGAVWASPIVNYQDNTGTTISMGGYNHPCLFDVNQDGLLDLTIGSNEGTLSYYENVGTATNPAFELLNNNLGSVDVSGASFTGSATPHLFESDGLLRLFVGNFDGTLTYYDSIETNLGTGGSFNMVSSEYLGIDVGGYSSFWVEDINNDGNLNMFVGQDLGGVFHFEADSLSIITLTELTNSQEVIVYPNPANTTLTIASSTQLQSYVITDINGRTLLERNVEFYKEQIDISILPKGIYIITMERSDGSWISKKIVKE